MKKRTIRQYSIKYNLLGKTEYIMPTTFDIIHVIAVQDFICLWVETDYIDTRMAKYHIIVYATFWEDRVHSAGGLPVEIADGFSHLITTTNDTIAYHIYLQPQEILKEEK